MILKYQVINDKIIQEEQDHKIQDKLLRPDLKANPHHMHLQLLNIACSSSKVHTKYVPPKLSQSGNLA
ncbi:hypothetical protein, partial [Algoriphagus sp.]